MGEERYKRKRVVKTILRETLAAILVLAFLVPALSAKERRGAQVVVTKRDGVVVQGELLAVKGTDLLIMDGLTSAAATESLVNVRSVDKIGKKSNWLAGMIIGVIAGAATGALVEHSKSYQNLNEADKYPKGQLILAGAVGYGLLGAYIGGKIKAKDIKVERTDPEYLAEISAKLNKWARNPR